MLEFILDGVAVTEPEGLRDLRHRIYYNDGLNGYLEQFDGQVSFYGSEYRILRNRFFADGCAVVPVEVRNGGDSYLGNIFLNDAEWQPDKSKVTCEIVDRSLLSLIDNNKDIKAYLNVPRSKNDVDISASTVVQTDLTMKEATSSDSPTPADRYGVRVYDAFKFLIAFMSDGQIGFVSDYFNPETDPNDPTEPRNPTLITGYSIRTGPQTDPDDEQWPYLSFEELFTDINKLYNISFSMEVVNGIPTMRIEPKAYFRSIAQTLAVADASGVQQEAVRESYYQLMKFGTPEADTDDYLYYPNERFQSWRKEEYHLGGQCNTKATLDLELRTLLADPNTIMRSLPISVGGLDDNDNDDEICIIVFDGNNETIRNTHPVIAGAFYYNDRFSNLAVANRWGDGVPFPIFVFLGADDDQAKVGNFATTAVTVCGLENLGSGFAQLQSTVFPFGYDPNGNIVQGTITTNCVNPATYYEVPATGIYTVNTRLILTGCALLILIQRRDASDVLYSGTENNVIIYIAPTNQNGSFIFPIPSFFATEITGSATFAANLGDKLSIRFEGIGIAPVPSPCGALDILAGSFMEIPGRGLITKTYDPADNYLLKSSAQYLLPSDWWRQFRTQWHQRIQLTYGSGQARGYVREISRNIYTGDADVEIVSKFADVTT
jgi:hypothetical protein